MVHSLPIEWHYCSKKKATNCQNGLVLTPRNKLQPATQINLMKINLRRQLLQTRPLWTKNPPKKLQLSHQPTPKRQTLKLQNSRLRLKKQRKPQRLKLLSQPKLKNPLEKSQASRLKRQPLNQTQSQNSPVKAVNFNGFAIINLL